MKPSRFTEEQIIGILREHEAGTKTADVCRKHGISSATFYKWKAKYGGLEVSDARRLKVLEDENAKLKKLLAEAILDNAMLKDVASKNVWSAPSVQGPWAWRRRQLRKCNRPLASRLLLQSGHDEIRAHRFHLACPDTGSSFGEGLTARRSTVSSSSSSLAIVWPGLVRQSQDHDVRR